MRSEASLEVWMAKSSELPTLICNPVLQYEFLQYCRLHANALTPCKRTCSVSRIRYQPSGNLYDSNCRRTPCGRQLAYAAGDHRLRLRDRPIEFRAPIEPRFFRPADELGGFVGPRRRRPRP